MPAEQQPGSDRGPTGPSRSRSSATGVPDGLLVSVLALLLGLTLLTWTAAGLAGLLSKGAWPDGVEFTHTPLAMRELVTDPRDLPGAWANTPPEALSGPGLFWGLFLGQLMILVVLTVFVLGVVARARAVHAARRAEREAALRARIAAEREARERAASERAARDAASGKKSGLLRKRRRAEAPPPSTSTPALQKDGPPSSDEPKAPGSPTANTSISSQGSEPQQPAAPTAPDDTTVRPGQPAPHQHAPTTHSATPADGPEPRPRAEQHTGAGATPVTVQPSSTGPTGEGTTAPGHGTSPHAPNHPGENAGSTHHPSGAGAEVGGGAGAGAAAFEGRTASDGASASADSAGATVPPLAPFPTPSPHPGDPGDGTDSPERRHSPADSGSRTPSVGTAGAHGGTGSGPAEDSAGRIREAPGAVLVATPDPRLWDETKDARAKLGPVHLYDPTHSCDTPSRLSWSPLHGCADRATAAARSTALLEPLRSPRPIDATTHTTAETVLRCWLHAAALEDRPVRELHRWALALASDTTQGTPDAPSPSLAQRTFGRATNRTSSADPVHILRSHPKAAPGAAGELEAVLTGHPRLRQEAIGVIRRALSPLEQLHIRNACTPSRADRLALESFLDETGTLYVVGSEAEAMPLLHALTQSVLERGRRRAARSSGGPIDPPLTTVLELNVGGRFH